MTAIKISLSKTVGKGYNRFWHFKGRYRVVKGSRASKKSKTTALWFIANLMKYPQANLLVIRKTYRTLKDSCFTELKWAIHRLQADNWWEIKESPLEMTYKPTGQKIYFRGLDDPLKVTSITVGVGVLCWAWLEEAYEVMSEADFDTLDESIRGEVPKGLFKQWTITFNPWNEHHWLKKRFFDNPDEDTLALTTNYMCNEWLDSADKKLFENMKKNNPRRYEVAGLGNTNDPTAFFAGLLDVENKKLYVFDELYQKALSNKDIYNKITAMGFRKERIVADSAEPKSIHELRTLGLTAIQGAKKGKDSIMYGVQWIQDLEIFIHPRCVNFLTEISNYTFDKDKFGNTINKPIDDFNHLMDAMRYALERYIGSRWLI